MHIINNDSPRDTNQLDNGVKIDVNQFKSGAINKPISIPGTYERLKQKPAGPDQITTSGKWND